MRDLFWLSKEQLARIEPFFPLAHGVPRVDDRKVISGIIFVIKRDCCGEMLLMNMDRTKPFMTASNVGMRWVFLIIYSVIWRQRTARPIHS